MITGSLQKFLIRRSATEIETLLFLFMPTHKDATLHLTLKTSRLLITSNTYLSRTKYVGNCIGSVVGLLFMRIVRMLNTAQRAPSFNIVVPGDFDSLMQF